MLFGENNWVTVIIWLIKTYLMSLGFCWPNLRPSSSLCSLCLVQNM